VAKLYASLQVTELNMSKFSSDSSQYRKNFKQNLNRKDVQSCSKQAALKCVVIPLGYGIRRRKFKMLMYKAIHSFVFHMPQKTSY
jgi:hypothetical protein